MVRSDGLLDLAGVLARGELTGVALVARALGRYAETEPTIHAFAWLDPERARRLAAASDARRAAGGPLGRLEGIPVAVKDIFDTAGIPTENGSAAFAGRVPERSSDVMRALEGAGAIVIGKTVTAELAYLHPGPTRNPWDPSRTPGGSSMGSAAAVAAGVVSVAIGSQTNGSVIRPAAFCGVVGFKPTVARISTEGVFEFSRTLDHVGVLASDVRGAALVAAILAADRERTPVESTVVPRFAALRTSEWARASEDMQRRFQADVDALATAGGPVVWPDPPAGLDDAVEVIRVIMLYEGARAVLPKIAGREDRVSALARERLGEGQRIGDAEYRDALRARERIVEAFRRWAEPYDAVLTPPTTGEAPGIESTGDPRFCSHWSLTGAPAITIPTGLGSHGLPLGLQLVAAPGGDDRLVAAALWAEERLPRIGRPPL